MMVHFGNIILYQNQSSKTITTTLQAEKEFLCYHVLFFKQHIDVLYTKNKPLSASNIYIKLCRETEKKHSLGLTMQNNK